MCIRDSTKGNRGRFGRRFLGLFGRGSRFAKDADRPGSDGGRGLISRRLGRFGDLVLRIVVHHQTAVLQRQGERLAAQRAALHLLDDGVQHARPVIDLVGDDNRRGQRRLARLRAKPRHAVRFGNADSANDHLGRAAQRVRARADQGVSRLGRQGYVAEGADVVDVDGDVGLGRLGSGHETVHVQLGIARLDRADDTQGIALG